MILKNISVLILLSLTLITSNQCQTDTAQEREAFRAECDQTYQEISASLREQDKFLEKEKIWRREMDSKLEQMGITPSTLSKKDLQKIQARVKRDLGLEPTIPPFPFWYTTFYTLGCIAIIYYCYSKNSHSDDGRPTSD